MTGWKMVKAEEIPAERHGWLCGHFYPTEDLRHLESVAVKFGVHQKGETRTDWSKYTEAATITILIKGRFTMHFRDGNATLEKLGDHTIMDRGVPHSWTAEEDDTVILTVRTPSINDMVSVS